MLLSSHILAEVEALCDRVSIIRAGRTVESGTLAELRHLTRTSIQAELAGPPDGLTGLPGVHDLQVDGTRVRCQVDTDQLDEVLRHLSAAGVRSLTSQPPTLEELFLRHYQADEAAATDGDGAGRPGRRAAPMSGFAGTGQLLRLALRRDRVVGRVWVLGLFVFAAQPGGQHHLAVPDPGRPGPAGQDGRGHRGQPGGGGPAGPGL